MKRQVIAVALGSLFALPALANNEIDAGYTAPAQRSTLSAEQVFVNAEQGYEFKATLVAGKSRADVVLALPALANNEIDAGFTAPAQRSTLSAEQVFVNAEQGYEFKAALVTGKSRVDVVSEVKQARDSGNYIVNAELGTKASQL